MTIDGVNGIARAPVRTTPWGFHRLPVIAIFFAALSGWPWPSWLVTEAPAADAASPGNTSTPPSVCNTAIPIVDAPSTPPASLGCGRDAQGAMQLQLVIAGHAPITLTGVDGASLLTGRVSLEPGSLSLHRLPGPPPLYWLRYQDRGREETGAGSSGNWRDLIFEADAATPVWLAEWTLADDRFSRVELHADRAESLTLDYRPPALWVTHRRAARSTWDVPGVAPSPFKVLVTCAP